MVFTSLRVVHLLFFFSFGLFVLIPLIVTSELSVGVMDSALSTLVAVRFEGLAIQLVGHYGG